MRRKRAYAKEEKLQLIIGVFLTAYQRGEKQLTIADIAHAMDNTPSTKLRNLVASLVTQSVLEVTHEPHAGIAGFRRLYSFHPDYLSYAAAPISRQKQGRNLRINTPKGSFIEVLR